MPNTRKNAPGGIIILGDIGGTNCRLANCEARTGQITDITVIPITELPSLEEAIRQFMNLNPSNRYTTAAISIANPINSDRVTMTNAHWDFSIEQTKINSGLDQLIVLNDWESVAHALPLLKGPDLQRINVRDGNNNGNRALCGVGTGLGAAGLIRRPGCPWVPVAGEGGHVSFSPTDKEETDILRALRKSQEHVSFEKILSGGGLTALHEVNIKLAGVSGEKILAPPEILARAERDSDSVCKHTIEIFCGVLGSFAGNLCLTLGANGGIYIGGGVTQKIYMAGLFDEARFLDRFTNKGRLSGWLGNIPAFILRTPYAGLMGAAAALGIQNVSVIEN